MNQQEPELAEAFSLQPKWSLVSSPPDWGQLLWQEGLRAVWGLRQQKKTVNFTVERKFITVNILGQIRE